MINGTYWDMNLTNSFPFFILSLRRTFEIYYRNLLLFPTLNRCGFRPSVNLNLNIPSTNVYVYAKLWYNGVRGDLVAVNFRRTKLERFIRRQEAKLALWKDASFGSEGYGRHEQLRELMTELKHEFDLNKVKESERK